MSEPWAPLLADVARHIPTRTRDANAPGDDHLLGTFTETTEPTADQAQAVIDGAVTGIIGAVGVIPTTGTAAPGIQAAAREAAAWQAAADIEIAYPDRNANVNVTATLQNRATLALATLREALLTETEGAVALVPSWSAPPPWCFPYGNDPLY